MALQVMSIAGGMVGLAADPSTSEAGVVVKIENRTGGNSVKGTLVTVAPGYHRAAVPQTNTYDTCGVVAESGIASGSGMWVWINGSICQVLYKNSTAATRGNILVADAVDGRASDIANPGGGLPGVETHFSEAGHVLETKSGGTNVLVLAWLHFN